MTRAVCPACRAPIALDAALCSRCGLAVRPTCASCGEALGVSDRSCPRCGEYVESGFVPPVVPRTVHLEYADTAIVEEAAQTERDERAQPPAGTSAQSAQTRVGGRRVVVQLIVIALVAGVLVAGGLLALELFAPRPAAPFDLVHRSVPDLGFSVSRPATWIESSRRVGPDQVLAFTEPNGSRGFRVVVGKTPFAQARAAVANEIRRPPAGTNPISTDNVTVDGRPAIRYALIKNGQYRQHWWVERSGGVFRVEFWGPEWNQRETEELAVHIIETFRSG